MILRLLLKLDILIKPLFVKKEASFLTSDFGKLL